MAKIIILTGPPGAGKSTIGKILAEKMNNSAVVSTDDLRHSIFNGKAERGDEDWERQLNLGVENACILANNYLKNEFNVFLDDIVCVKERLKLYEEFIGKDNFKIIFLMPEKKVLLKRDLERGEWAMKERAAYLYDKFVDFIESLDNPLIIDNTSQTQKETADQILEMIS
jgi:adenylate kinase family enzyme